MSCICICVYVHLQLWSHLFLFSSTFFIANIHRGLNNAPRSTLAHRLLERFRKCACWHVSETTAPVSEFAEVPCLSAKSWSEQNCVWLTRAASGKRQPLSFSQLSTFLRRTAWLCSGFPRVGAYSTGESPGVLRTKQRRRNVDCVCSVGTGRDGDISIEDAARNRTSLSWQQWRNLDHGRML